MRRQAAAAAIGAALVGVLVALLLSTAVGFALAAALPHQPGDAVTDRLPFWIAATALGGGLQVIGPAAGRISMLNDGGLLGPLQGASAVGRESFRVDVLPLPITVLSLVAVAVVLRGRIRRIGPGSALEVAGCLALVAAVFAGFGMLLATTSTLDIVGGQVHPGRISTPIGGAALGLVAAAAGLRLGRRAGGRWALPIRAATVVGTTLAVTGVAVLALVAATARLGVVDTLVTGDQGSRGLKALLGALLGPALAFDGALAGAGAWLHVDGHAFGFSRHKSYLLPGLVHAHPLMVFLPVVTLVAVLAGALVAAATGRAGRRELARSAVAYAVVFAGFAVAAWAAARIQLRRVYLARAVESASVRPDLLATVLVAALAGLVVALIGQLAGGHRHHPAPAEDGDATQVALR